MHKCFLKVELSGGIRIKTASKKFRCQKVFFALDPDLFDSLPLMQGAYSGEKTPTEGREPLDSAL